MKKELDALLRGLNGAPLVLVGPLRWLQRDARRYWYFMLVVGDELGARDIVCECGAYEDNYGPECRAALYLELLQRRLIVVHDMDDELHMARLCEKLWPDDPHFCEIREGIEAEVGR